jgi:predicted small metal-binding protein
MDEVLLIAIEHLEEVRHASTSLRQGVHLKMASLAMRCALQMYAENQPEERTDA